MPCVLDDDTIARLLTGQQDEAAALRRELWALRTSWEAYHRRIAKLEAEREEMLAYIEALEAERERLQVQLEAAGIDGCCAESEDFGALLSEVER